MNERLFLRLDDDPVQGPEADAPADTLRAVPVSAALRPHVSHILLCNEHVAAGHEVLERVLPDGAVRLIFDLGEVGSPSAVVAGASTAPALVRLRGRIDGVSLTLCTHAARLIAASNGRRPLREVAETVGVGQRRLQQLFHAHVGLSPRAWGRLARLHGCLRALRRQANPDWAEMAIDHGYYDQSHLANEFRALCGLTPTEFLGRAVSGSSKTAD
jgi:AraC-like DNA-binding protein